MSTGYADADAPGSHAKEAEFLAKATARFVRGSAGVTRALERVEIDHTLVDTHIVDALDRKPIGRPWLTIAIDVATRACWDSCLPSIIPAD
jgi:transposase InsO family protein